MIQRSNIQDAIWQSFLASTVGQNWGTSNYHMSQANSKRGRAVGLAGKPAQKGPKWPAELAPPLAVQEPRGHFHTNTPRMPLLHANQNTSTAGLCRTLGLQQLASEWQPTRVPEVTSTCRAHISTLALLHLQAGVASALRSRPTDTAKPTTHPVGTQGLWASRLPRSYTRKPTLPSDTLRETCQPISNLPKSERGVLVQQDGSRGRIYFSQLFHCCN